MASARKNRNVNRQQAEAATLTAWLGMLLTLPRSTAITVTANVRLSSYNSGSVRTTTVTTPTVTTLAARWPRVDARRTSRQPAQGTLANHPRRRATKGRMTVKRGKSGRAVNPGFRAGAWKP